MPWKVYSLVEARQRFVRAVLRGGESVAQLCRRSGISRKTGFKWLGRFRRHGGAGLANQSRRPRRSPGRLSGRWLRVIEGMRRRRRYWGGKKIYARLRRQHPRAHLPKVRTIAKWLQRRGWVRRRRASARRGPWLPGVPLTVPQAPNQVWTVDFKGWFRTLDGQRVDPLTVRDLFSRYVLGIGLLRHYHEPVRQYFQCLFRRFGQPAVIRVDHGQPFAGDGALDLSRLLAWWLRLGIRVEFTRRAQPQDNGAHEQMHRVYKAEVASPPAATPRAQQQRSTRWVRYYNHHRPHEALGQRTPASLYRKSRRPYRGLLPSLRYPRSWPTRQVTASGYIRWHGRLRVIGRAFGGQRVGFKPAEAGIHEVYFDRHLIGLLVDRDAGGLRPARRGQPPPLQLPSAM
jgi:transposase InsO family protein